MATFKFYSINSIKSFLKEPIWYNSFIAKLLPTCHTIMLFGVVCTKRSELRDKDKNHEFIHCVQYKEVAALILLIFAILWTLGICPLWHGTLTSILAYYIIYCIEYVIDVIIQFFYNLFHKHDLGDTGHQSYRCLAFEEEAYDKQSDLNYLKYRKPYAFLKYYGTVIKKS